MAILEPITLDIEILLDSFKAELILIRSSGADVANETTVDYKKQSFIYDFLSSMRQKVNDPLGKRKRD